MQKCSSKYHAFLSYGDAKNHVMTRNDIDEFHKCAGAPSGLSRTIIGL